MYICFMHTPLLLPSVLIILLTLTTCQSDKQPEQTSHAAWSYQAEEVDDFWASLNGAYKPCKDGRHQSPVNISSADTTVHKLQISYTATHELLENNGHTVMLKYDSGSYLDFDEKRYQLLQMHFHTPAEHYYDGEQYPLEAHLVHAHQDTIYLVYSIMFQAGATNTFLDQFINDIPLEKDQRETSKSLNVADIVQPDVQHFYYEGSFTTPPCTEGVKWIIQSTVQSATLAQINYFKLAEGVNARPTHKLFDRLVEVF
ncbi:MAG: carbonic anhydrase [Cyclobacteriaceae bacterium]|jgi:carbonic anhydrase